ncbi:hypothetical protein CXB51_019324 [Gossypium anomalum]|uniref:Integrase catalytic domain-containing protein n=1 Tax=Gossypium anomalum TaxID=47600 RepID=A0A8J5YW01_9ROSI|nr:hypothetical protein CXB51_019324 [Gossypium anomalum]
MQAKFEILDLGEMIYFFSLEVIQARDTIFINQKGSQDQLADILTKPLGKVKFENLSYDIKAHNTGAKEECYKVTIHAFANPNHTTDRNTRFALWQIMMQAVLAQMDLKETLLGVDKMPSTLTEEKKKRKDRKVLTQLHLHLSNKILQDVMKEKTEGASVHEHLMVFKEILSNLEAMEVQYDKEDLGLSTLYSERYRYTTKSRGSSVTSDVVVASSSLSDDDITKLWHMRLGHMSENGMAELSKRGLLDGVPSRGGANYMLTSIDNFSRKVWAFFLKQKSDVFFAFKSWKNMIEKQMGKQIKYLHTDNSLEFRFDEFNKLCKSKGTLGVEEPRYKVRLVAKGYSQIPGVDFTDVFSAVVKHSLIRALLGIVAMHDLELEQLDSPRQWYKRFDSFMTSHDFKRSSFDSCVYSMKNSDGSFVYLLLYVDDMLIATKDKGEIRKVKAQLSEKFEMKDLGPAKKILGIEILRDRKATHFRLSSNLSLQPDDEIEYMSHDPYSSAVGSLITRDGVIGYVNANFTGDFDRRRSLTGYVFIIRGCAISWKATLQTTVALSTPEAEYMVITEACKEVIWLKGLFSELNEDLHINMMTKSLPDTISPQYGELRRLDA